MSSILSRNDIVVFRSGQSARRWNFEHECRPLILTSLRDFSGYVASDESVGDVESAEPVVIDKPKTVGDVMSGENAPANFELGIELQRGINLKVKRYGNSYISFHIFSQFILQI